MTVEQDEVLLRKKARRRLVGAILLALIVVLSVPLVLDDPSRPLGEGPEIVIPEPANLEPPRPASVPDALPDDNVGDEALPVEGGGAPLVAPLGPPAPAATTPVAPAGRPATTGEGPPGGQTDAKPIARGYLLQLGVFRERANADAVAAKAAALGLEPVVAQSGDGSWRVGVGPFTDKAEAFAARDKVREAGLPVVVKLP